MHHMFFWVQGSGSSVWRPGVLGPEVFELFFLALRVLEFRVRV